MQNKGLKTGLKIHNSKKQFQLTHRYFPVFLKNNSGQLKLNKTRFCTHKKASHIFCKIAKRKREEQKTGEQSQ
jgi:hypothetical protein